MAVAVFLDKDGMLVENVPYNIDPARIHLLPGAADGLQALHAAGFRVIVVSNQSGVARGFFGERALVPIIQTEAHLSSPHCLVLGGRKPSPSGLTIPQISTL